jgi:hypothetical protein
VLCPQNKSNDKYKWKKFTRFGQRGRNFQSTGCVLGGTSRVKVLSLDPQLLRLDQLPVKPRGLVPNKRI